MDSLKYEIKRRQDIVILELRDEVDSSVGLAELIQATEELMTSGESRVVINLSRVTFMDSSAVGWLIRLKKQTNSMGGDLKLISAPEFVIRLLSILHLEKLLEIFVDEDAAIESFMSFCPSCSGKISMNDPFCRHCGHKLKDVGND